MRKFKRLLAYLLLMSMLIVPFRSLADNTTVVTISDDSRNDAESKKGTSANGVYFKVSPSDELAYSDNWKVRYKGDCVYVNGVPYNQIPFIKITENVYYVGLADADMQASHGTTVRISGTLTDGTNTVRFKSATFEYTVEDDIGIWTLDPRLTTVTISDDRRNTTSSDKGIYFNVSPTDNVAYDLNWNGARYLSDCIYVDDVLYKSIPIYKITEKLYYAAISDIVTPTVGMKVRIEGDLTDGTNSVRFQPAIFAYGADEKWRPYVQTVVTSNYEANKTQLNENYVYFYTSPTIELPSSWQTGYYGKFLTINGTVREDIPIKHIGEGICLLDLYGTEFQNNVTDNMSVSISGILEQEGFDIQFQPICFQYSEEAQMWRLSRPNIEGVVGDATGDGEVTICDLIRMKHEIYYQDDAVRVVNASAIVNGTEQVMESDFNNTREILLSTDGIPYYADDLYIQLGAYEGPSLAGKKIYTNGEATGTIGTSQWTSEEFQRYADAGLNTLITESLFQGIYRMKSVGAYWRRLTNYMKLAENQNLDVIVGVEALNQYLENRQVVLPDQTTVDVTDEFLKDELRELLTGFIRESEDDATLGYPVNRIAGLEDARAITEYNGFKGILMADELTMNCLNRYTKAHELLWEINPSVGTFFSQHAGKDYVEPFGSVAGNFCYDYYPFARDNSLRGEWLTHLENAASAAKGKFKTGITLQSHGQRIWSDDLSEEYLDLGLRDLTSKADIGFQVYTSLAYGMKSINYYTYAPVSRQSQTHYYTSSMVMYDEEGNIYETDLYDAVQAVNKEILQFDHVFMDYDWQGTIAIEKYEHDIFNNLTMYNSDRISSYVATQNALIGCMRDAKKGLDGFWVVNATDPVDNLSNTVSITFNDATRVLVYDPASDVYGQVKLLNDGIYIADLGSGEGQFVIPLS